MRPIAGSASVVLIGFGQSVSGYQSPIIGIALMVLGVILGIYFLAGYRKSRRLPALGDARKKADMSRELREVLAEVSKEGHAILPAANEGSYNAWVERGVVKIARYDAFLAERFKRGFDPSQPLIHPSVERFINWRLDLLNEIASQAK